MFIHLLLQFAILADLINNILAHLKMQIFHKHLNTSIIIWACFYFWYNLTYFEPLFSFDNPLKHHKMMFSGGRKRDRWHEWLNSH